MMNIEKNILNNWLLYHAEIGVEMVVAHNHKNDRVLSCMEAQKIFIDNEYSRINVLILDELLASNSINAIGEIGFDFFTKELASTFDIQQEAFNIQIELAIKFSKPVIIHCRKGMDKIFIYSKQLSKLPAVIFHSFSGSSVEGNSLLKKGINCFFSFGKSLLKEKNRCIQCAKELPLERILAETDAPFHKLPLEKTTLPSDIILVYKEISKIKEIFLEEICLEVEKNFYNAFG